MNKIILLTDYRNSFYSRMGSQEDGFDHNKLESYFKEEMYDLEIIQFGDLNFTDRSFEGIPILYTSLEDPELYYKSFIEDIILGLEMAGAWLIPKFYFLRAHHNKVFMEIIRNNSSLKEIKNLKCHVFGVASECVSRGNKLQYPLVLKPSAGAMSMGVTLVKSNSELSGAASKLSKIRRPFIEEFKNKIRPSVRRLKKIFAPDRKFDTLIPYQRKFVSQQYIPGLNYDFKVLVYYDKYYVIRRENRKNDFRASGSGLLSYPLVLPDGLLEYAEKVFESFRVPFISMDIAFDSKEFYLIEFQFLMFGTYTLEKSTFYYQKHNNEWDKIEASSEIEKEFVRSIIKYLESKKA